MSGASRAVTMDAELLRRIRQIWDAARSQAARSVNSAHVGANWLIGQQIVEAEQGGAERAEYGSTLLKHLSQQLATEYGSGFSVSALQYMRAFYLAYPELLDLQRGRRGLTSMGSNAESPDIQHAVRVVSAGDPGQSWKPGRLHPTLSWTHYRALLKVSRPEATAVATG